MGWFKRVMDKLGSDEPDSDGFHTVELDVLQDWIEQVSEQQFVRIKPKVEELLNGFFEERRALIHNLDQLGIAQLHNPEISEREKQIMEGNRTTFIHQHKQFANLIEFPSELSLSRTVDFCRNFEDMLVRLAKSSSKGHMVMSQFFADHSSRIGKNVKSMSDSVTKVMELLTDNDLNIDEITELKRSAQDLKAKYRFVSDVERETKVLKTKLANSIAYKDKLLKKMEDLKLTEGYAQFSKAAREKEELYVQVRQIEADVQSGFSSISRPTKKFERILIENPELFRRYIDDPMSALVHDEQLMIVMFLERMRRAMADGQIDLEEKESVKMMERVDALTKSRLLVARTRYLEAKHGIKQVDDQVRVSTTLQELDDLNYKVDHTSSQVNMLEEKIESSRKSIDRIDLDKLRQEMVVKVKETLGADLAINWSASPKE